MIGNKKLWLMAPVALASVLHAGNVVSDWTAIASTTSVANGGKASPSSFVWFAYSSLAAYDAVNAITGEYEPFYYRIAGPAGASIDAAAIAATHRILVNYLPANSRRWILNLRRPLRRSARVRSHDRRFLLKTGAISIVNQWGPQ
jgi:hypothetical protein